MILPNNSRIYRIAGGRSGAQETVRTIIKFFCFFFTLVSVATVVDNTRGRYNWPNFSVSNHFFLFFFSIKTLRLFGVSSVPGGVHIGRREPTRFSGNGKDRRFDNPRVRSIAIFVPRLRNGRSCVPVYVPFVSRE